MARSTLLGIMGQTNYHAGKEVTWEEISSSDFQFTPKPEDCRADTEPPTRPGAEGIYPVACTPGVTKLL